jgi:hypothetical protein
MLHQLLGRVPRVHQHGAKAQFLPVDGVIEHFLGVGQLGLLIFVGYIDAPIDDSVAPRP